ncbi:MAG: leucine-rich repeat protein [Oscillospiraceae bacterium]|nr:leucine-rich repeat protein [Oscillospiraceae bacterium]
MAVLLPTQAKADYTSGDWTYKVYEEEVIITGYSGSDTKIVIPDKIDGMRVVGIGEYAFSNSSITELTLGEDLRSVGKCAFWCCTKLEKITVKSIALTDFPYDNNVNNDAYDEAVFQNAGSKSADGISVVFAETVTRIPANMFRTCDGNYARVKLISVGKNVKSIGASAFRDCGDLEKVVIPHDSLLTSVGSFSFAGTGLKEITLPEQLTTVGDSAFWGCTKLEKITVKSVSLTDFPYDNNVNNDAYDKAVFQNAGLKAVDGISVVISDTVTKIPANMFKTCDGNYARVKTVNIGKNVKSIGVSAFRDCGDLEKVVIPHDSLLTNIGSYAFTGTGLKEITFPEQLTTVGDSAFWCCTKLEKITVKSVSLADFPYDNNVNNDAYDEAVFQNAGSKATDGISVIFADTATKIPANMFKTCDGNFARIKTVNIGKNVKSIGASAFRDCGDLEKVVIPHDSLLTSVGSFSFAGTGLKEITLPEQLTTVGDSAFWCCTDLEKITVKSIALTDFPYDNNVNNDAYDEAVFQKAGKNTSGIEVVFTDTVTTIPANMFRTTDGNYANVRTVTIRSNVETVGYCAFAGCENLQFVSIPADGKIRWFGEDVFNGCKSLKQITIPSAMTQVWTRAFNGSGLTDVYYGGNEEQWNAIVIKGDNAPLTNATLHYEKDCNGGLHMPKDKDGVPPTCEESGLTDSSVCTECGKIFVPELFMSKLGHDYVGKVTKEPSCFVDGSKHFVCANDPAHTYTDVLAAPGMHTYIDGVCSVCGDPGDCKHAYEIDEGADATCVDTGLTEGKHCYLCNTVLQAQEIIPATGVHKDADHDQKCDVCSTVVLCEHANQMKLNEKVPTCEESGLTEGLQCKDCGEILKAQEAIPATGHKDADHDRTCDKCGLVLVCEHPNLRKLEGKEATCTEDGLTAGVQCEECEEILTAQAVIPAKGHDYESKEDPAATCTESGKLVYTCKNDPSHSYEIETPAKGHNFHKGECVVCGAFDDFVNPFIDVKENDWFYQSVIWAVRNDVTGGTSSVTFSPNDGCTRAQVVTFLWAANGKPEPTSKSNPFKDVKSTDWFYQPVLWAVENGITGGVSANEFGPNQTCTRAQIVTFLYAAEGKPYVSGSSTFADVKNDDWFAKPVIWAAKYDVTGGIGDGKFGPNNTCTRAQVVTFLYKADQVDRDSYEEEPAPELDDDAIYAAFLNKRGYMTEWNKEGLSEMYPPNEFIPDGQYHPVGFCQIDIDQNGLDELVIVSDGYYVEFVAFLVFTIDEDTGEVVRLPLLDEYGSNTLLSYGGVEYSPANMALVITPAKAMGGDGSSHDYYMIAEERMTCVEPPDGIYDCELLKEKALP